MWIIYLIIYLKSSAISQPAVAKIRSRVGKTVFTDSWIRHGMSDKFYLHPRRKLWYFDAFAESLKRGSSHQEAKYSTSSVILGRCLSITSLLARLFS